MANYHLRGSHIRLIARAHARYSVRGGAGLVFLFLSLITGLIIAAFTISPVETMYQMAKEEGSEASISEMHDLVVQELGGPAFRNRVEYAGQSDESNAEQTEYLLLEKPAVVSAFMIILMILLPFLVSLGAFNQTSGDISNRGLRYILLRTERGNLFLGRLIGTYLFTLMTLGILFAGLTLYLVVKLDFYPAGDVVLWMLWGLLKMSIYVLPWIAMAAWISATIDSPFGALVIINLIAGLWPVVIALATDVSEYIVWANYALPWGYKYWLWHPDLLMFFAGTAAMLGFTALFTWLGMYTFQKRDV